MARLEISSPSDNRVYDIHDPLVTIGSAANNHVVLNDPGVAPVHLRLNRTKEGFVLELADPDYKLAVNGQACTERKLKANDKIKIGDTVLKIVAQAKAAAHAPAPVHAGRPVRDPHTGAVIKGEYAHPKAHGHHGHRHGHGDHGHGHGHGHHGHGDKKKMGWPMWVGLGVLGFGLVIVVMQLGGAGSYYAEAASPEALLQKAEEEFKAGNFVRAQDNLLLAERYGGSGIQAKLKDLKVRVDEKIRRSMDQDSLNSATKGLAAMQELEQKHLSAGPNRPAARDITRKAQGWLKSYTEVTRRWPDTADQAEKVQALAIKYETAAQLDKPDDAGDVLYQADLRFKSQPPLYREALQALEGYLNANRNDVRGAELYAKKSEIIGAARAEYDRHEAEARQHLAARRFPEAKNSLTAMRKAIVENSWDKAAKALEAQIAAAEK